MCAISSLKSSRSLSHLLMSSCLKGDSTVNVCGIDLSMAFDKVKHHALYLKLMKRFIPKKNYEFITKMAVLLLFACKVVQRMVCYVTRKLACLAKLCYSPVLVCRLCKRSCF